MAVSSIAASRSRWCRSLSGKPRNRSHYTKSDTDRWIEDAGRVIRLLTDDDDGSRHQRFVIRLGNGQTLLIAHNIDLAARIPLALGDRITFRGIYEWNDLGGVVHWTHDDPMGNEAGGFVQHQRKRYS